MDATLQLNLRGSKARFIRRTIAAFCDREGLAQPKYRLLISEFEEEMQRRRAVIERFRNSDASEESKRFAEAILIKSAMDAHQRAMEKLNA